MPFQTEAERLAFALYDDLTARYAQPLKDLLDTSKSLKVPVIRIKTTQGEGTYALFLPFVEGKIEFRVPLATLRRGQPISLEPPIPECYD